MADWPDVSDVVEWGKFHENSVDATQMHHAVTAAVGHLTSRCVTFTAGQVPEPVRSAAVLLAARLYRRRDTPEGASAFGGDAAAGVIRHDIVDRDVEQLIRPWLAYPIGSA